LQFDVSGKLIKEKKFNAKKATTYFIKTIVDKDWNIDTFNKFANKLAEYSIKINEYMEAYKQPDVQDNIDGNEEKMDTSSVPDDTHQVRNKPQSNITRNDKTVSEDTNFSFNDLDFDVNGGAIIPPPSSQTSTVRTPLSTVDVQQISTVSTPPNAPEKHPKIQKLQSHSYPFSNALSPPSMLSIFAEDKSPTPSAQKRLRFELNGDD